MPRIEGRGGAGDIENPQQLAVDRVPDRSGCARPPLDIAAEMLDTMDLDRSQLGDGGSDCIRSDVCLGPVAALFEVHYPT
jgi:hypothetical protein